MIELGVVKPLLDAPANTIEAAQLVARMIDQLGVGRIDLAVRDAAAADTRVKEVAGALLSVIPIGMLEGAAAKSSGPAVELGF